jgi:CBS domain-containing protein
MSELRLFPALVSRGDAEIMTHAYVKDIMTAAVVAVRADASYQDLAGQLRRQRVSGFPVVDDEGMVIGVVSESDLLAAAAPGSAGHGSAVRRHLLHHQQLPAAPTAADLMTSPTVTIGPDETARRATQLLSARKLRRLPVVDHDGHLVGILSRADVLSVFARPDEEIRREVCQDVIADGFFLDPAPFTVTVTDGIVTLAGDLGSVILGRNIADQVRHLEGVVAVRDRFTYPLPVQTH